MGSTESTAAAVSVPDMSCRNRMTLTRGLGVLARQAREERAWLALG